MKKKKTVSFSQKHAILTLHLKKHTEFVNALKLSQKMTSYLSSETTSAVDENVMKVEMSFFICQSMFSIGFRLLSFRYFQVPYH